MISSYIDESTGLASNLHSPLCKTLYAISHTHTHPLRTKCEDHLPAPLDTHKKQITRIIYYISTLMNNVFNKFKHSY